MENPSSKEDTKSKSMGNHTLSHASSYRLLLLPSRIIIKNNKFSPELSHY
jgi:hypothetical protein